MLKITPIAKVRSTLALMAILCLTLTGFAQNQYSFVFNDEYVTLDENIATFEWSQMPESSKLANGYFGWIQFRETPNQQIQDYFKDNDLMLLDYVGASTYLFYMEDTTPITVLRDRGVRAIVPVAGRFKMDRNLLNMEIPAHAQQGDRILVSLEYHDIVNRDYVLAELRAQKIEIKQVYESANFMDLVIPNNCLETLSESAYVRFVELAPPPPVEEDVQGKSIHRSNGLDTQMAGGWDYTGTGVGVLVRDDGVVGPHIDFQGRINNVSTSSFGSHGDGVSGIFAGAGNLNPRYRGMAAGADLYVANYVSNFLDTATTSLISAETAMITNSSFGDGCNDGYTFNARIVDQQTNDFPRTLHVFSAGNSGGSNCGYGAGTAWGTITGGHKQGKNVIATANVFFNGALASSSSRGPATDGRIKPDITAHGQGHISTAANNNYQSFGGTSGAAPGVAGVAAQLYELYADTHGGVMPESGLVKAAMLNTANDRGNVGPDFRFGWGIVNGLRAGNLLNEDRFLSDNISDSELNTTTLSVPAGTTQMRIMLYWTDPAAATGASVALVNDLDLVVKDPSDSSYLPWILDPTPSASALNAPATNGEDHLNNMEQVLINNPVAGNYTVEVSGFNVPFGPQNYFIVYEFIQEQLSLVYPNYAESLVPGEIAVIHWDAVNTDQPFNLEYTTDDGSTWNTITTVSASASNYSWEVPETITGQARVRISSGTLTDESDNNFDIALQPTGVEILQVCDISVAITWDAVADAESYDVYLLGTQYMEVVENTTETWVQVPIASASDPIWVAVAARNSTEDWVSLRTNAIDPPSSGLLNCDFANDLAVTSIDNTGDEFNLVCDSDPITVKATIFNSSQNAQSGFEISYQIDSEPTTTETFSGTLEAGNFTEFSFATPLFISDEGDHDLTVTVNLLTDEDGSNNSDTETFYVQTDATDLNDIEDFQTTGFPSEGWNIVNPDDSRTWAVNSATTGSDGETSIVGLMNNYNYTAVGEEDYLITEVYNITGPTPIFTFELAKAQRNATNGDTLRVEISTDCGTSYSVVYDKTDAALSTVSGLRSSAFIPSADDWRTEEIDLAPYIGQQAQFRFTNVTGNGNYTYIDNIKVLSEPLSVNDQTLGGLTLYPNPTTDAFTIASSTNYTAMNVSISNTLGQMVLQRQDLDVSGGKTAVIQVAGLRSGIYFVRMEADGLQTVKKLVIR